MSKYTNITGPHWAAYKANIDKYVVLVPVVWDVGRLGSELVVTVPVGTPFDVSVPPYLRWLFDPHNTKFLKAACLHDYLLTQGWSRIAAGAIFHDALLADGVGPLTRLAMWLAVSLRTYHWN